MMDPVRPEAVEAIAACRQAGIRPVMITGDHRDTAAAIARQLGILEPEGEVLTGAQLSQMDDRAWTMPLPGAACLPGCSRSIRCVL